MVPPGYRDGGPTGVITADSLVGADSAWTADGASAALVLVAQLRHADLLKTLLPPVAYDPAAPDLAAQLGAEGGQLDDAQAAAERVLAAITPEGDTALLPDWERVYGLPDTCMADLEASITSRIAAVIDKIRRAGGLSRQHFIDLAAALGYAIAITEYQPYTVLSPVSGGIFDSDSQYYWTVDLATDAPPRPFTVLDGVTTPLVVYQTGLLECLLHKLKPAHTELLFAYS